MNESDLQLMICRYLKMQYPEVMFRSDFAAGIKMTIGQARKHKSMQQDRAYPDLFIAEPVSAYHGLFLELKKQGTRIVLKNGSLSADKHIQEQAAVLKHLHSKGYAAAFAVGFDQAKQIIDNYMKGHQIVPVIDQFIDHIKQDNVPTDELPF